MWLQDEKLRKAVGACNGKNWKKIGMLYALQPLVCIQQAILRKPVTMNFFSYAHYSRISKFIYLFAVEIFGILCFRGRESSDCCFVSQASCLFALICT